MSVPKSQVDSWGNQGAIQSSINSHMSVRHALEKCSALRSINYDVSLQGSYKNHTNIRGDSDVDVVVRSKMCFYSNLTREQLEALGILPATYNFYDFRKDVLDALKDHYGSVLVEEGDKAIHIRLDRTADYVEADVVICTDYRYYENLNFTQEGIAFFTRRDNRLIFNYPIQHHENGNRKSNRTNGNFRKVVRIAKNARRYLVQRGTISNSLAPSYFLECFIYNAPDELFCGTTYDATCDVVDRLLRQDISNCVCQNEINYLWGDSKEHWDPRNARSIMSYIAELIGL